MTARELLPRLKAIPALCLGALLLAAALVVPSSAAASSIVYIKDGNVWQSSPDGATNRQLTTGGSWHSPTQADDGTIAAVNGFIAPITVMDGYGRVIREVPTPGGAATSNGGVFPANPVSLDFSADGTMIGYEYSAYSCPPASSCGVRTSSFYTHADQETPIATFGNQFNISDPSMLSPTRALVFGGYGRAVNIDDLGGGDDSNTNWFNDQDINDDATDLSDGELSRDGSRFAALRNYGSNLHVQVYKTNGDPLSTVPAAPSPACETSVDENTDDPTFSPDGKQLAVAATGGVYTINLPEVTAGDCPGATMTDTPILAGATEPDWGPADVKQGQPPADPNDPDPNDPDPNDPDPNDPDPNDPDDQPSAACKNAKSKLAAATKKLKAAKRTDKKAKVKKAKAKVKKAKGKVKKAC